MSDVSKLFEVAYERRDGYLYERISGDTKLPETKVESWREIIGTCRAEDVERLLVTMEGQGNVSEVEAFETSRDIVALGLDGIKIAYVDLDPANHQNNQFGELVAENRGAFARVFTNEKEAEDWLLSENP